MKQFLCIWDKEIFHTENITEIKGIEFFTLENGYSKEEIENINNMEVGDIYNIPTYPNQHIITRIKDI